MTFLDQLTMALAFVGAAYLTYYAFLGLFWLTGKAISGLAWVAQRVPGAGNTLHGLMALATLGTLLTATGGLLVQRGWWMWLPLPVVAFVAAVAGLYLYSQHVNRKPRGRHAWVGANPVPYASYGVKTVPTQPATREELATEDRAMALHLNGGN